MAFSGLRHISFLILSAFTFLLVNLPPVLADDEQIRKGYKPSTAIAHQIDDFHYLLLIIITAIVLFVLLLLIWVMVRYNEKANPVPSKTSHHVVIEVLWTVVPILILLVIAIPSFRLLAAQYTPPKSDIVIKAIGFQWAWSYEYPEKGLKFESRILDDKGIQEAKAAGQPAPRLLAVDNPVVLPVGKVVYVQVSANDVIHNWTVPAFGVKMDAMPKAPKMVWFKTPETPGIFYGQCSELCGKDHAFMPIEVRVVSEAVYAEWLEAMTKGEDAGKAVLRKAVTMNGSSQKMAQTSGAGQ